MQSKKVNVLGTEYLIDFREEKDDSKLSHYDGYCDDTTKQIVVEDYTNDKDTLSKGDLNVYAMSCLRHELIHAFLFESGLAQNSKWANNEEAVDWIARQFPKILEAFKQAECI